MQASHLFSRGASIGFIAILAGLAMAMAFAPAPSLFAG